MIVWSDNDAGELERRSAEVLVGRCVERSVAGPAGKQRRVWWKGTRSPGIYGPGACVTSKVCRRCAPHSSGPQPAFTSELGWNSRTLQSTKRRIALVIRPATETLVLAKAYGMECIACVRLPRTGGRQARAVNTTAVSRLLKLSPTSIVSALSNTHRSITNYM
jgi:hypothetical protein